MPDVRENARLITCILPKGKGRELQEVLVKQHDIWAGNFHFGRGIGRESKIGERGIGEQQEREIFEVVVDADRADELFELIYFEAGLDEPHTGMVYMAKVPKTSVWVTPDGPMEEDLD